MKKSKKRLPSSSRSFPSRRTGGSMSAPPENFIQEMLNLFNSGDLELFEQKTKEAVRQWPNHPFGWKARANLLLMQGKLEDALQPLSKCLELEPDDPQAINNLGSVLLELRHLDNAEKRFREALAIKPDYAQAHCNLGITLLKQGRFEESVASYRRALALMPDFAEAHNNLGNALKELGKFKEAEASYLQAVAITRDFAEGYYNLGNVLLETGRFGEAKKNYRQAIALNPDYAQAHSGLGDAHLKQGRFSKAIVSYRKAINLDPLLIRAHDGLNKALGAQVPPWHVPMMNDRFRNDAYHAALQNAVTSDTHVLEIGTGSGLLAMMAARLGAKRVTTCEAVPEIAEMARAIIAENGLTPPVTVVPKISTSMEIGEDMEDRADLLVSEILSSEFFGEGVFSSIEDAKRRLLKPGGRIIPARGSVQFALFGGDDIEKNIRVDEVYGFNLRKFNEIVVQKTYVSRNDLNIDLLSGDTTAYFIDFVNTDRFPYDERKIIEVPVLKAGRCSGIIQWLRLEMDDTIVFENHPSIKNAAAGWQHCIYALPSPVDVQPGQIVLIAAAHNRDTPWFFFEGIKEPATR